MLTELKKYPENWQLMTLSETCKEIASGGTPSRTNRKYFGGTIPWVVIKDIKPLITETSEYLTDEGLANSSAKLWPPGTVILSTGATVGKVGIAGIKLCTKQGITGLIPKDFLNNEFLAFYLDAITEELNQKAAGVTIREIYKRELIKIKIPIPPLETQTTIVSIIKKANRISQKRQESMNIAKDLIANIFIKMFGDPEKFPDDFEIENMESCCEKIIDTPHSTVKYFSSGIPVIRTSDIGNGKINFMKTKFTSKEEFEKRKQRISPQMYDVLYTREAPWGNAAIVTRTDFTVGQRMILLRPDKKKTDSRYFTYILNDDYVYKQAKKVVTRTTTEHVNIKDIKKFKIPLPSLEKQNKFGKIVKEIDEMIYKMEILDEKSLSLLNSLQDKVFKGELVR